MQELAYMEASNAVFDNEQFSRAETLFFEGVLSGSKHYNFFGVANTRISFLISTLFISKTYFAWENELGCGKLFYYHKNFRFRMQESLMPTRRTRHAMCVKNVFQVFRLCVVFFTENEPYQSFGSCLFFRSRYEF